MKKIVLPLQTANWAGAKHLVNSMMETAAQWKTEAQAFQTTASLSSLRAKRSCLEAPLFCTETDSFSS